eukprot:185873-Chlamydomonas_euryale.AAC.3
MYSRACAGCPTLCASERGEPIPGARQGGRGYPGADFVWPQHGLVWMLGSMVWCGCGAAWFGVDVGQHGLVWMWGETIGGREGCHTLSESGGGGSLWRRRWCVAVPSSAVDPGLRQMNAVLCFTMIMIRLQMMWEFFTSTKASVRVTAGCVWWWLVGGRGGGIKQGDMAWHGAVAWGSGKEQWTVWWRGMSGVVCLMWFVDPGAVWWSVRPQRPYPHTSRRCGGRSDHNVHTLTPRAGPLRAGAQEPQGHCAHRTHGGGRGGSRCKGVGLVVWGVMGRIACVYVWAGVWMGGWVGVWMGGCHGVGREVLLGQIQALVVCALCNSFVIWRHKMGKYYIQESQCSSTRNSGTRKLRAVKR